MIDIRPLNGAIGAEIRGIDLSQPLQPDTVHTVKKALYEHLVVFFREQKVLSSEEHCRAGAYFGTLDLSEIQPNPTDRKEIMVLDQSAPKAGGGDNWHRDRTYLEAPPMGSMLQCVMKPNIGGDTCWANMYLAYEELSKPFQKLIDGLSALHSIAPLAARSKLVAKTLGEKIHTWPTAIHPLVEVHPETGRKALNVNANWTTHIVDVSKEESDALLNLLFNHVKRPDYQVRFSWNVGDVAFWDNRATLHCAVADYTTRRIMKRVAIVGHKPMGPNGIH
jgi:taurine dioxygenase